MRTRFSSLMRRAIVLLPVGMTAPATGYPRHACEVEARTTTQVPSQGPLLLTANQGSGTATLIELKTGKLVAHIPVGPGPHEVAASADGRRAIVTVYGLQAPGNQLAVLDLETAAVRRMIDLGIYTRPHGARFLADNRTLLVTSETRQAVVVVDVEAGTVLGAIPTGNPGSHMLALPRSQQRVYTANIGNGTLSEMDVSTRALVRSMPVATRTEGIGVTPDGTQAWLGSNDGKTVSVVDLPRFQVAHVFDGFGFPYRIGFSPDGSRAIVTDPTNDEVRVYDARALKELGRVSTGKGSGPEGVFFAPDGRMAYLSLNQGNAIAEIDVAGLAVARRFDTELRPDGVTYVNR